MLSLALCIVFIGIIMNFHSDILKLIKKIANIPGAKLVLPLLIVTSLITIYTNLSVWVVINMSIVFINYILSVERYISFNLASIILLLFEVLVLQLGFKSYQYFNPLSQLNHSWVVILIVWLISSVIVLFNGKLILMY